MSMSLLFKVSSALLFFSKDFVNNYEPLFRTSLGTQFNLSLFAVTSRQRIIPCQHNAFLN